MGDRRFKLNTALFEAGLANTEYAREVLNRMSKRPENTWAKTDRKSLHISIPWLFYELSFGLLLDVVEQVLVLLVDLLDLLRSHVIELVLPHKLLDFPIIVASIVIDSHSRTDGLFQILKLQPFSQSEYIISFSSIIQIGIP